MCWRFAAVTLVLALRFVCNVGGTCTESCTTQFDQEIDMALGGESLLQSKHTRALAPAAVKDVDPNFTRALTSSMLFDMESYTQRRLPKVLRSMDDKTTLFYHVHIPKTGGTTVANLLVADICAPNEPNIKNLDWDSHCGKTCEMGLSDNEFSCVPIPNGERREHCTFAKSQLRANRLMAGSGAKQTVYVTTLRRGSDRVISQWLYEVRQKWWLPPPDIAPESSESLRIYVTNGPHRGNGWIEDMSDVTSQRNNYQVATLASKDRIPFNKVTRADLEKAKATLLHGNWIIGFTNCMDSFHKKLMSHATRLHGQTMRNTSDVPYLNGNRAHARLVIRPDVKKLVDSVSQFDNELYNWAWEQAKNGSDPRWSQTC